MKYPTFEMMKSMAGKNESEVIMSMIYKCIDYIYDKDQIHYIKDVSEQELEEFIDNIQQKDLEKIRVFFDTMPKIKKDAKKLQSAADELVAVWDKVRPEIEAKGGTAQATVFGKLVGQLKLAKAANDYGKLATPILDEVDNLEKVYKK